MYVIAAFFDKESMKNTCRLKGKYIKNLADVFPDYRERLMEAKACLGYIAGRDNADENAVSIRLKDIKEMKGELVIRFEVLKKTDLKSGYIGEGIRWLSERRGWLGSDGLPPLLCFAGKPECKELCGTARKINEFDALFKRGEYKDALNLFAPLREVKSSERFWNDPAILCRLGVACSKLAVTLKIKAQETKKLKTAAEYRKYCEAFLLRGAKIEDGARCASALAYRYYSNVHELTREGERRDQDLEEQIEKANEWLSRSIEIYPQSIKNNYRKGKLIVEKQAPYLLYGKRSFGEGESRLLREIREVGEEYLASAVAIYELLEDDNVKRLSTREYAKALFALGGYYLDNSYIPMHEYFFCRIAGREYSESIPLIAKLDMESARENLEKCIRAETDMPLTRLDTDRLAGEVKKWARSPIEKLYRLGCAYSVSAFIFLVEGNGSKASSFCRTALYYLNTAKNVAGKCTGRESSVWHISEKTAWTYIISGQYDKAAKLLSNATEGYLINTYATALLLAGGSGNAARAKEALKKAAEDKSNLAAGLSRVLLGYAHSLEGEKGKSIKNLSAGNKRLAGILGVETA